MKKIVCKKCGEIDKYYTIQRIRQALYFDANDDPCGGSEPDGTYYGTIKRCPYCGKAIKIVESDNED